MFIPLGDDNTDRHLKPFVVFGLVAINALVWFLQMGQGDPFTMAYATIPLEISTGDDLVGVHRIIVDGQAHPLRHYPGPTPIYLTLLTAMFMHGGWMHIIGNMVYLFIFGDQIEDRLGHAKFLVFYLICGLVAGLAQVVYQPDSMIPCVGASGAIAGVLGAYLVIHPKNQVRVLFFRMIINLPAVVVLGGWFLLQVVSQVSVVGKSGGGVAYMAHIGGFVAGVVLILIFGRKPTLARARAGYRG